MIILHTCDRKRVGVDGQGLVEEAHEGVDTPRERWVVDVSDAATEEGTNHAE